MQNQKIMKEKEEMQEKKLEDQVPIYEYSI